MAKERVTHDEYLQLVGLYTLANSFLRQLRSMMDAVNEIVGGNQDDLDNHVNDVLWGSDNPTADDLIKSMKIAVDPPLMRGIIHFSDDATNNKCSRESGDNDTVTTRLDLVTCDLCEKYVEGFQAGKAVAE